MALQASDIPETVKLQMLDALRNQLGDDKYQNLVAAIGKDGLINLSINQLSKTTYGGYEASSQLRHSPTKAVERPNILLDAFWITFIFLAASMGNTLSGLWVWLQFLLYSIYWLGIIGPAFFIFLPSAYILSVVYLVIRNLIGDDRMAIGLKVVGVTAILGVVVYLSWLVVPWLITGVRQWWAWLGGHF